MSVLSIRNLTTTARERLEDARCLHQDGRHDGAVYVCGYAVEIALKVRICRTLHWPGYPENHKEFQGYQSFRVHDLPVLLTLSGFEPRILTEHFTEWSALVDWTPSLRYYPSGGWRAESAKWLITSARVLLDALL